MLYKKYYLLGLLLLSSYQVFCQNTIETTNINICSGRFFDSGGETVNYGFNEDFTSTICSDDPTQTHINIIFRTIDIRSGDQLCFFDGTNTSAPSLGCNGNYPTQESFSLRASANNASGCITLRFTSDNLNNGAGWKADVFCAVVCQTVEARLVSTDPVSVGGYIDICQGESVTFTGRGIYPENNTIYNQSDATSTFNWSFGDGGSAIGRTVTYTYNEPGGYNVQLFISDLNSCNNSNLINQKIRVAPEPKVKISNSIPKQICSGDLVKISAGLNSSDDIFIQTGEQSFTAGGIRADSIGIPDGTGVTYETDILISDFSSGQTLQNVNDLLSVCINMEHSFLGDLEIILTCPSGNSIILHNYSNRTGGNAFLGEPIEGDEGVGQDPIPGVGYNYCWTPDAARGTWLEYTSENSLDKTLPAGDYSSFQDLSELIGCPLNGNWKISILDDWPDDNGIIFSWSIDFDASIFPEIERFTVPIVQSSWENSSTVIEYQKDTICAQPDLTGNILYSYNVEDAFGCTNDIGFNIIVSSPFDEECRTCNDTIPVFDDIVYCDGDVIPLSTDYSGVDMDTITFEKHLNKPVSNTETPPGGSNVSSFVVENIIPKNIEIGFIESICLDLDHERVSDLSIYVRLLGSTAPNFILMDRNGGNGKNLSKVCFTPQASRMITDAGTSDAPYTGNWLPVSDWNSLNGIASNLRWGLYVEDYESNNDGILKSWSLTFKHKNELTYQWESTSGTLSCLDCPDPILTPVGSGKYDLTVSDSYGCDLFETGYYYLDPCLPCTMTDASLVSITPTACKGISSGGVNVTTGGTSPVTYVLDDVITQMDNGTFSNLSFGGHSVYIRDANDCDTTITFFIRTLSELSIDFNVNNVECAGETTGSIQVIPSGGTGAYSYQWAHDNQLNSSEITNLGKGIYSVTVTDSNSCFAIGEAEVTEAGSLSLRLQKTDVSCYGKEDGRIAINVNGGERPFRYNWSNGSRKSSISNLSAGVYSLTLMDANGCAVIQEEMINEPDSIILDLIVDNVDCIGDSTGVARVVPSGGVGNFSYLWTDQNKQSDSIAIDLSVGEYPIQVIDISGCVGVDTVNVGYSFDTLKVSTQQTFISCFNESKGVLQTNVEGGNYPYQYSWSNGYDVDSINMDLDIGAYYLTVTDESGCTQFDTVSIVQYDSLQLRIMSTPATCFLGSNGTATIIEASGGNGMGNLNDYSYYWESNPTQSSTIQIGLKGGEYHRVTIVDKVGCMNVDSVYVDHPDGVMIVEEGFPTTCNGDSDGMVLLNVTGGTLPYNIIWDAETGSATTDTVRNLSAGTYAYTLTDGGNCVYEGNVTVEENPPLDFIFNSKNNDCFGDSNGNIEIIPEGGSGIYGYIWDTGETDSLRTNLNNGDYSITISDSNNCMLDTTFTIVSPDSLALDLQQTAISCHREDTNVAEVKVGGGVYPYNYEWENNTAQDSIISNVTPGIYPLTVTDANLCFRLDTIRLVEYDSLALELSSTPSFCFEGDDGTATVITAMGGVGTGQLSDYNFYWDINPTQSSISQTGLKGGQYHTIRIEDAVGCSNMDSVYVDHPPGVEIVESSTPTICNGDSNGTLNLDISGGTAPYDVIWGNPLNLTGDTLSNLLSGTYNYIVRDGQGCERSGMVEVGENPPIDFTHELRNNSCFGSQDGAIKILPMGGTGMYTYLWNTGQTDSLLTTLTNGVYNITITDSNNCSINDSFQINSPDSIGIVADIKNLGCNGGKDGAITVFSSGGIAPYEYSVDGINYQTESLIEHLEMGAYTVFVRDSNLCVQTLDSQNVNAPLPIDIQIGDGEERIEVEYGTEVDLFTVVNDAVGNIEYMWSSFTGDVDSLLSCTNCLDPMTIPMEKSNGFIIVVRDDNNCTARQDITISVVFNKEIYVPSAFTPNEDGINDGISVYGKTGTKIIAFQIFDRWGGKVFNAENFVTNDETIFWDGSRNGEALNSGVFVWKLVAEFVDGEQRTFTGNITLIR